MTAAAILMRSTPGGVRMDVRVTPRASKVEVGGVRDGRLLVRVTAPPVDDAANEAVRRALAGAFDVAVRAVTIVAGASARNKSVEIAGVDPGELARRLDLL